MATVEERQEKGARNQALFRDVNERIERITETEPSRRDERCDFLCECADPTCVATLPLTLDEYERIRGHATRFPVKPGHDDPEIERVVEEADRYVVVEKLGVAADVAKKLDPRR